MPSLDGSLWREKMGITKAIPLDGQLTWLPEISNRYDGERIPANVGKICAWGGLTVTTLSDEVPYWELDGYAQILEVKGTPSGVVEHKELIRPLRGFKGDILSQMLHH